MASFIIIFFGCFYTVLWLWALINVIKSDFSNESNKIIWLLVIILLPFPGALLYLFIGRDQRVRRV